MEDIDRHHPAHPRDDNETLTRWHAQTLGGKRGLSPIILARLDIHA